MRDREIGKYGKGQFYGWQRHDGDTKTARCLWEKGSRREAEGHSCTHYTQHMRGIDGSTTGAVRCVIRTLVFGPREVRALRGGYSEACDGGTRWTRDSRRCCCGPGQRHGFVSDFPDWTQATDSMIAGQRRARVGRGRSVEGNS